MAGKRGAQSELNHDNWDDDFEPEEAGTFKRAPDDIISKRVIKTAKRRNPIGKGDSDKPPTNVFSNFGGFTKTTTPSASPFAFLSNLTSTTQSNTNGLSTTTSTSSSTTVNTNPLFELSTANNDKEKTENTIYLSKLQSLNESVTEWIKTHVDKNPYCILTPVFKDYEKHLAEIEKLKESEQSAPTETSASFKISSPEKKSAQATSHSASIFGKSTSNELENPFLSKSAEKAEEKSKESASISSTGTLPTSGFSFGNAKLPTAPTTGFSFGSGTPFTFSNVAKPITEDKKSEDIKEDDEEPPKNEFTPVVEDDNIFSKRCKVFIKKDDAFSDRGVGQLFLKPIENSEKVQLIVRQDTSLGNLLLNLVLSKSIPTQRMGKNNVMLVCIPDEKSKPPPVPILLRVKTAEEADELLRVLEKHKN